MSQKPKESSFIKSGSILYELTASPEGEQLFTKYDPISQQIETLKEVIINDIIYSPPQTDLVFNGTIKLAVYPMEFGTIDSLLSEIKHFLSKYVDLPSDYLVTASYYILLTWVYDRFDVIPYLRVIGNFGTGKTRFLKVLGSLCYKACFAGGATTVSPIFRIIDLYGGITLVFDEADFGYSGPESEIVKILNCGYMKGMPVLRTEGDKKRVPTSFNVYGPKVIATRSQFNDVALESRCLTHIMTGHHSRRIPIQLPENFEDEALELRNKLLMFRFRHYFDIRLDPSLVIEGASSRSNQIALPLLSLASSDDQASIVTYIQYLKGRIKNANTFQEPTLLIQALVSLVLDKKELTYSLVAQKINELTGYAQNGHYLSPSKIGRVNSANYGLDTRQINGVTQFNPSLDNIKQIQNLAAQCNLSEVDEVDLVDVYFGTEKLNPEASTLEKALNESKLLDSTSSTESTERSI